MYMCQEGFRIYYVYADGLFPSYGCKHHLATVVVRAALSLIGKETLGTDV